MGNVIKNSNTGFKHEDFCKVAFVVGRLYDELPSELDDWDELQVMIENITIAWEKLEDIRDLEEEGYIQAYAERVIREYVKNN